MCGYRPLLSDSGGVSRILYEADAACVGIGGTVFLLRRVAPSCTCMVEVIFLFRRFSPPCARTFTADFSACCSDLLFRRSAFLRSCLRRYDGVGRPVLKIDAHGAHVRGTKQVWGDQKADGPENLLALRAEGTRVSS